MLFRSNLNSAVNRFSSDVCKEPKAAELVDICVMAFNHEVEVVQDWAPITAMRSVEFTADGGTNLSLALEAAIDKMRQQTSKYEKDIGMDVKMPYIILITDAEGGDVTEVSKLIKKRTDNRKMKLWVLGVKGYNKETVFQLTDGGKRVFELVDENGFDFRDFFSYISASIKAVSVSAPGAEIHIPDNENPLAKRDTNLKIADKWLND